MSTRLTVVHRTVYRYATPVRLGPHRLMCRPRDSHDLRLLGTGLTISPPSSELRWIHDVFGNSIAIALFDTETDELSFESTFRAEHFPAEPEQIVVEPYAQRLPFSYAAEEMPDLARNIERHYPDPAHQIDEWARGFLGESDTSTFEVLTAMNQSIREHLDYARREEEGTQTPVETLERSTGSCRDFALLMMEGARSLGLAARFVSGYLYDEELLDAGEGVVGGGETHAWLQVYLPGAGWVPFDPTNALVGGRNLIRVAVAREPAQAAPISGSFTGERDAFIGMEVDVTVTVG